MYNIFLNFCTESISYVAELLHYENHNISFHITCI